MADDLMYWNGATWVSLQGVAGPQGVPGPNKVSLDAGNTARLGSDGLVFVAAPVVNLPVASATILGAVKIGSGITVAADGTISIASGAGYLPLAGGTMTGTINVAGSTGLKWPTSGIGTQDSAGTVAFAAQDGSILFEIGTAAATSRKPLIVPLPTSNIHAANKQYVDESIAALSGANYLPLAGGTMTGTLYTNAGTAQVFGAVADAATSPYLSKNAGGDFIIGNNGSTAVQIRKTDRVATFLAVPQCSSAPINTADLVNKAYVDSKVGGGFLPLTGGTLTGPLLIDVTSGFALKLGSSTDFYGLYKALSGTLRVEKGGAILFEFASAGHTSLKPITLPADPTVDMEAATKKYVDAKVAAGGGAGSYLPLAGGTMTGGITLPTTVQSLTWGTSTYNIFGANGGVAIRYGTANIVNFTATSAGFIQKITTPGTGQGVEFGSGGGYLSKVGTGIGAYCGGQQRLLIGAAEHTSSVPIVLPAAPTAPLQAATKQYVDARVVVTAAGAAAPAVTGLSDGTLWVEA